MILQNRVAETTSTTGYDNLILNGALWSYETFTSSYDAGESFVYCIVDLLTGVWEIGIGYLTPGGILIRDTILDTSESTSAPSKLNLTPGLKRVFVTPDKNIIHGLYTTFNFLGAIKLPTGTAEYQAQVYDGTDYQNVVSGVTEDIECGLYVLHFVDGILTNTTPLTT
jgi:hypothetical protein